MLFWLALITFVAYLLFLADILWLGRRLRDLASEPLFQGDRALLVSVLIPARNEERNIEEALQSVLAQDYPALEFIILNDRSTDRTGEILRGMAAREPRLRVIDIEELPVGWLGKNWALALGASRAAGDLLLFTDADIVMHPTVISRAVGRMLRTEADHVTIGPRFLRAPDSLKYFLGAFAVFFGMYCRPWRAQLPGSRFHVGIGAFNLLRRAAYEKLGTHRALAMRPDDDMKLGKLVKLNGLRQEFVPGGSLVQVEWYASLRELIDGLMKNTFAGLNYSVVNVIVATVGMALGMIWPFLGLVLTRGAAWWLNLGTCALIALIYFLLNIGSGIERRYVVGFPAAVALLIYIMWRSMRLTLREGGIRWRGTHYPLALLRANKI